MDGMLMEWEKMLPDPDELNDLDNPDLIENDLPVYKGKNESTGILETAKIDSFKSTDTKVGEKTQYDKLKKNNKFNEVASGGLKERDIHVAPSNELEESALTLKLIDELNSDDSTTGFVENKERSKFSDGMTSSLKLKDCKLGTEKVGSSEDEAYNSNEEGEVQTPSNYGNPAKAGNRINDNFENCLDSPLQISDVRSGDIPEKDAFQFCSEENEKSHSKISDSEENSSKEDSPYEDMETQKHQDRCVMTAEENLFIRQESGLNVQIKDVRTEDPSIMNEENDNFPGDLGNITNKPSSFKGAQTDRMFDEGDKVNTLIPAQENHVFKSNNYSEKSDMSNSYDLSSDNLIMLAVKQEPMDYEEYGKPEEFMSNFYSEMDGNSEQPRKDYTPTENGLCPTSEFSMTPDGLYQCRYCCTKLSNYGSLQNHLKERHKNMYQCKYCDCKFYRSQEIAIHCRMCHTAEKQILVRKEYDSDKNKKAIFKKKKAKVYYDSHGNQIYKCAYCSRKFRIQQAMASHVRNCHHNDFNTKEKKQMKKMKHKMPLGKCSIESEEKSESGVRNEINDDKNSTDSTEKDNEIKSKFSRTLPYRNMSFETDSSQIEENLASSDCSLKRELKSSQIYHCSKCTKWFYREKQVLKHEETCTGVKQEPSNDPNEQEVKQELDLDDGIQNKFRNRQEVLKNLKMMREKNAVERKIQSEITKKLREKVLLKKKKPIAIINKMGEIQKFSALDNNTLPKYCCKYCPSSYGEGHVMNFHLVKHLGEVLRLRDRYKCKICCQYFPRSKFLISHLQKHTELDMSSLYKLSSFPECNVCGQPFVNVPFLRHHENEHISDMKAQKSLYSVLYSHLKTDAVPASKSNLDLPKGDNYVKEEPIICSGIKKNASLDHIPFQCGICLSRFPNSQFLLHHITLHMQGPYVFKIEVDKKEKSNGGNLENLEKLDNTVSSGNFSIQKPSGVLQNKRMYNLQDSRNLKFGNIELMDVCSASTGNQGLKSIDLNKIQSVGMFKKDQNPSPTAKSLQDIQIPTNAVSTPSTDPEAQTNRSSSIDTIAQDHMYAYSNLHNNDSETDSATSSDNESSAYYETDEIENEETEKEATSKTNLRRVSKNSSVDRKCTQSNINAHRIPNFKKTLNIASGDWFECPFCLHISKTATDLDLHMRNHNKVKTKVKCLVCQREFLSKWHLSRHMDQSHRQNSYKCSFCDEGFLTSLQVMEHVENVHH